MTTIRRHDPDRGAVDANASARAHGRRLASLSFPESAAVARDQAVRTSRSARRDPRGASQERSAPRPGGSRRAGALTPRVTAYGLSIVIRQWPNLHSRPGSLQSVPLQHAWPAAPQGTWHTPLWQVSPVWHGLAVPMPQHACPVPPHAVQVFDVQLRSDAQRPPTQHACPDDPQFTPTRQSPPV